MSDEKQNERISPGQIALLAAGIIIGGITKECGLRKYMINDTVPPAIRVNKEGISDIILKRTNGEEMILYGTREGNYIFGEKKK